MSSKGTAYSRSAREMAELIDKADSENAFWDVLAMNGSASKPMPEVYKLGTPYDSEDIPLHYIHATPKEYGFGKDGVDVFIAGSGPVGATYARKLVDAGLSVVMCELGATDTKPAASHKKNEIEYQKDIDRFVNVIKGALSPVSVPTSKAFVDTLDPSSWNYPNPFVTNGKNPRQKEAVNLSAQAVTRGTGGMATHWTCAVPHFLKGVERPVLDPADDAKDDSEWENLYKGAGELVNRSESEFDGVSIRHTLVLNSLREEELINPPVNTAVHEHGPSSIKNPAQVTTQPQHKTDRVFKPLPLAARRLKKSPRYVEWMSAESVFDDLILQQHVFEEESEAVGLPGNHSPTYQGKFRLLTNHRVTRYALEKGGESGGKVVAVEVQDLMADRANNAAHNAPVNFYIKAKYFVTACGAVANPQVLYNSGLNSFKIPEKVKVKAPASARPSTQAQTEALCRNLTATVNNQNAQFKKELLPNLGHYITEQPMAFCQVVLKKDLVDLVPKNPWNLDWWEKAYKEHLAEDAQSEFHDPLPFPRADPEPQITSPVTVDKPWHTQIHRDAFSYGAVAATIDSRLVVDFRWFGATQPEYTNYITFERDLIDAYGMPQPTFHYQPGAKSTSDAHRMMIDMCEVAQKVGGYLPGSEPQFMAPGLALHLGGTTRLGHSTQDSCANFRGQVNNITNLYVAGNGVIDTPFAANPTLTSMALAIYSAEDIANKEGDREVTAMRLVKKTETKNGKEVTKWVREKKTGKVKELFTRVEKQRDLAPWPTSPYVGPKKSAAATT